MEAWILLTIILGSIAVLPQDIIASDACENGQCSNQETTEDEERPLGAVELDINGKNLHVCPAVEPPTVKPEERFKWYKVTDKIVYFFSAFYDDREEVGGPMVRVLANGHQLSFHPYVAPLYCLLAFEGFEYTVSVLATYTFIYPSTMIPNEITGHWVECPVSKDMKPIAVTVLPSECPPESPVWLPVQIREESQENAQEAKRMSQENSQDNLQESNHNQENPQEPNGSQENSNEPKEPQHNQKAQKSDLRNKRRVALCTPALYDARDWIEIAEWIIVHKLLGYSTVYFYKIPFSKSSIEAERILDMYSHHWDPAINVVVIPWHLPREFNLDTFYYSQHASINDCLYRAGLTHDYVTVCDKDEILLPMHYATMPEFIAAEETDSTAAHMFQHVMFDTSRKEELTRERVLELTGLDVDALKLKLTELQTWVLTRKWRMEEPYPAQKIRSKTLYNVRRTVSADIHFPKRLVAGYSEKMVSPSNGVVLHYKNNPPVAWLQDVPYIHGTPLDTKDAHLLKDLIHLVQAVREGK